MNSNTFVLDNPKNVYVVAEAGINHNGSMSIAKQMIESAAKCGCDAVKFQTIFPEELFTSLNNPELFEMAKSWNFTKKQHIELKNLCEELKIDFFSTPFGLKSAKLLVDIDVKMIKIASGELNNHELIAYFSKKHIPIILSTGFSTLSEISQTVELIKSEKCPFAILHCNASYPTPIEDLNLVNIQHLKTIFNTTIGFSDHSIGNEGSLAAVSLGAKIIEKHFTLDTKMPGPDQELSSDPKEFSDLIQKIRKIEKSFGKIREGPTKSEEKFKQLMRKSVASVKDIPSGTKITNSMLKGVRPGTGISIDKKSTLVGLTIKKSIKKDEFFEWGMF